MKRVVILLFFLVCFTPAGVLADDLSFFVSKYGKPDIDDSTQFDNPRPPIVTRWLVYKK